MNQPPTPDLRPAIHEGAFWLVLGTAGHKLLGLAGSVVLARLLFPEDFGLFALAGVAFQLAALFDRLGTTQYVISAPREEQRLEAAHRLNLAVAWGLALLLVALAPVAARFFDRRELLAIIPYLALTLPVGALGAVQAALLTREMKVGLLARWRFWINVGSLALTLGLAAAGLRVWALVIPYPLHSLATALVNRHLHPWRPRLPVARGDLRVVFGYGRHILGMRLANYLARQMDNAVVGRVLGAASLGIYDFAYQSAMAPLRWTADLAEKLAFPAQAHEARRGGIEAGKAFLETSAWTVFLAAPVVAGMVAVAPEWVRVLYGVRWDATVPLIRVLAPATFALLVARPAINWMQTTGREAWPARIKFAAIPALGVALALTVGHGIDAVARGVALVLVLQSVGLLGIALGAGAASSGRWLAMVLRSALPALLMMSALVPARGTILAGIGSPALRLAAAVVLGIATFSLAAGILVPGRLRETTRLLGRRG